MAGAKEYDVTHREPRLIVGIGAGEGGLDAVEQLFAEMPADTGIVFVVVAQDDVSKKPFREILQRRTGLPVTVAEDQIRIEPDRVYLARSDSEMILSDGRLLVTDRHDPPEPASPVDVLFRSLAEDAGPRAVAIVLSGRGDDGSRGVREVHEACGLVIVQDQETAGCDEMPRNARKSGCVDHVAAPREVAGILAEYLGRLTGSGPGLDFMERRTRGLIAIFRTLEAHYGIDFSSYKPSTVTRRVERRLHLLGLRSLEAYAERLDADANELDALYRDLLIGVTRFFRDTEAFAKIEQEVLPAIFKRSEPQDEIRVWVPGCATGEEAYSLAILIHESVERAPIQRSVKIFATDVHPVSLEVANRGLYRAENVARLGPARLARYFEIHGDTYEVAPELRRMIVFARHNVIRDAPFTHLDLISCRNLLIYLQPVAQRRVLGLFRFALRQQGVLFLGPSENAAALADDFSTVDAHWRIYQKRGESRSPRVGATPLSRRRSPGPFQKGDHEERAPYALSQTIAVYDALLEQHMPPSLLVNDKRELVHAFGGAARFVSVKDGRSTLDILGMVGNPLKPFLAAALQRVSNDRHAVAMERLTMALDGEEATWRVAVKPVDPKRGAPRHALVTIELNDGIGPPDQPATEIGVDEVAESQLAALEAELGYAKETLNATIEELETANEELQDTNEDLLAANEELQSTNEELQSVNEELYTVNAEYQRKIAELTELTNDIDNLLQSTDVGTVFLDRDLCVRRFTPRVAEVFNLLPQDVGRSIVGFTSTLRHPRLIDDLRNVLESSVAIEREVQDSSGGWFFLRVLPYRAQGTTEGVVLTLIDIHTLKAAEDALFRERHLLDSLMESVPDAIYFKDAMNRFVRLNRAMARRLGLAGTAEAVGKRMHELVPPALATAFDDADAHALDGEPQPYRLEQVGSPGSWYMAARQPLHDRDGSVVGLFGISRDVTEQKQAEDEIRQSVVRRDRFLAMLSHELRNPLSAIVTAARLLAGECPEPPSREVDVIERQARQMTKLLDDLLEASRITQNKISLDRRVLDLRDVIKDAEQAARSNFASRSVALDVQLPDEPLLVDGDPVRLQQILMNLLGNAAKYTQAGGRTELRARKERGRIVLTVQDDGAGIEPKHLAPIFDIFFQAHTSLFRADSSLGLGLALVRSLVEMHGGQVAAHSEGPGRGSTFTVSFPLARASAPAPPSPARRRISWTGGKRIVLIDDNVDSCLMLQAILTKAGYEVQAAHDGLAGLDLINRVKPDVALVDIGLPGIDGYEVAARLRAMQEHRHLYLVAFTGYGMPADRAQALRAGFDEHLTKPFRPEELSDLLEERH